jgi:tRNA dimethylallyltransferase
MIKNGLIEEIERLLEKGYSPSLPAFSAIGYSQLISYLQGKISLEEAIRLIKRQSRIFVRRQANWFKEQDNTIHWFDAGQPEIMKKVMVTVHDPSCWTMVEKKNG